MPALPAVPKVVRVALTMGDDSDNTVVNRFYLQYTGTPATTTLDAYAATVGTEWSTSLAASFGSWVVLRQIDVEDLTSTTSATGSATVSHAGSKTGAKLSAGTAAVVRYKINRRYRGGHPRSYFACFDASDVLNSQTWEAASLSLLVTHTAVFFEGIQTALNSAYGVTSTVHCNVSYYQGFHNVTYPSGRVRSVPTLRSTPVVDLVQDYSANPNIASQRRRNLTP